MREGAAGGAVFTIYGWVFAAEVRLGGKVDLLTPISLLGSNTLLFDWSEERHLYIYKFLYFHIRFILNHIILIEYLSNYH